MYKEVFRENRHGKSAIVYKTMDGSYDMFLYDRDSTFPLIRNVKTKEFAIHKANSWLGIKDNVYANSR